MIIEENLIYDFIDSLEESIYINIGTSVRLRDQFYNMTNKSKKYNILTHTFLSEIAYNPSYHNQMTQYIKIYILLSYAMISICINIPDDNKLKIIKIENISRQLKINKLIKK